MATAPTIVDRAWSAASTASTATTAVARCNTGTDVTGMTYGVALTPGAVNATRAARAAEDPASTPASTARCAHHDLAANSSDFRHSTSTTATVVGCTTRAYHDLIRRRVSARWHDHRRRNRRVTTTTATARAMLAAEGLLTAATATTSSPRFDRQIDRCSRCT